MKKRTLLLALAAVAAVALVAAGCGDDDDDTSNGDEPTSTTDTSTGSGPGISVSEALDSELDGPLLVNGVLVANGDDVRLCELLAESFPPQCGGASLEVAGLDLASVDGTTSEGDVTWTDFSIQLLGDVEDGVLTVSGSVT